ncbi:MAG: ABC-2 type transport system ATP-binding protein [Chloroflexi bacterium]|nr:MAG: ABC-2 type transport system ATP-binding protein [Chloroflexota bacterium]
MAEPHPVIWIDNVSKSYGHVQALSSLNLSVHPGEIFGFLGPNGAGKTTAIRVLMGFLKPTQGIARVFDADPWLKPKEIKARIGFLPDASALYDGMTGNDFLNYLAGLHSRPSARREELCDRLELSRSDLQRKVKGYSHGMRRKLGIVQSMQHDPDLLIMDEPTQGLDPLTQQAFFVILREAQARGCTIFFSSHVLSEVEELCQRVGIIRQGTLVAVEQVRELRRRKVRTMEVEFKGQLPPDLQVEGVEILARGDRWWRLAIKGDINPVLRVLASHDLEDLVFESPHLEDIFLDYYRDESVAL